VSRVRSRCASAKLRHGSRVRASDAARTTRSPARPPPLRAVRTHDRARVSARCEHARLLPRGSGLDRVRALHVLVGAEDGLEAADVRDPASGRAVLRVDGGPRPARAARPRARVSHGRRALPDEPITPSDRRVNDRDRRTRCRSRRGRSSRCAGTRGRRDRRSVGARHPRERSLRRSASCRASAGRCRPSTTGAC